MDTLRNVALGNAAVAALLALVAAAAARAFCRPALTHALWLLVLIKLVTPPICPLRLAWPSPPAGRAAASVAVVEPAPDDVAAPADHLELFAPAIQADVKQAEANEEAAQPAAAANPGPADPGPPAAAWSGISWCERAALGTWFFGSLGWFLLAGCRLVGFRRLLRHGRPADAPLGARVAELSRLLGLPRPPVVRIVPGAVSPMVWAFFGPASLLFPAGLLERLSAEQRDTLLVHELAHLRRRDHWIRLLEFLVAGIYWWHPAVWWARREIREAEEQCCDSWVVWALPDEARGYALALVETIDFLSEVCPVLPPAVSGIGYVRDVKRRMTMILRGTTPRSLGWAGGAAVLVVAGLLLPLGPSIGGSRAEEEDDSDAVRLEAEQAVRQAQDQLRRAQAKAEQAAAQAESKKAQGQQPHKAGTELLQMKACQSCHGEPHKLESKVGNERIMQIHDSIVVLDQDIRQQRERLRQREDKLKQAVRMLDEVMSPEQAHEKPRGDGSKTSGSASGGGGAGAFGPGMPRTPEMSGMSGRAGMSGMGPVAGGMPGMPGMPGGMLGGMGGMPGMGSGIRGPGGFPDMGSGIRGPSDFPRGGFSGGGGSTPGVGAPGGSAGMPEADQDARIRKLSEQMDQILKEMDALKRELKERNPKAGR